MDDNGDPPDEKVRLGNTAAALRRAQRLSQGQVAEKLRVDPRRVSKIETGTAATAELIEELAGSIDFRPVHVVKTLDLFEYLDEERRRPLDPIGPTPQQEVAIHEACRELSAEVEAIYRVHIRRENLKHILEAAAGQWRQLESLAPAPRETEVRRDIAFHTWGFCFYLCAESVRQATDDPKAAVHVGRLAVVAARCCVDLPWADRLVAYALAHLANTYRVLGKHHEADKLFAQANRLWSSPGGAAADPGVLDPGRIHHLEAAFRKDQRQLLQALDLLDKAFKLGRDRGWVLIHRALVVSLMGSYEEAIETLRRADTLLEDRTPRDGLALSFNTGVNLCHLNRFDEAAKFCDSAFKIAADSRNQIDILRCRWLRARVLDGQEDLPAAVSIYWDLVQEFGKREMTYDHALVTLELAAVLLALGRTRECRFLTIGLPAYFEGKEIYPEALAALKVFCDSVSLETATEALARQVATFLYLAQGTPGLRFVPASS